MEEQDLCDYDLGIDIEKELHKVMQNVSMSELVKLPSIKDQVQQFLITSQWLMLLILFESCHIQSVRGREVEVDPPIQIHIAMHERKSGGYPPFYLTLQITTTLTP